MTRPTSAERATVIQHIANAPFDGAIRSAEEWQLGRDGSTIAVVGEPHPGYPGELIEPTSRLTAAEWKVAKRIALGQWRSGTTTQQFRDDLRAAVRHPQAALHVGMDVRLGESPPRERLMAGILTELAAYGLNVRTVPRRDRFRRPLDDMMFVVYDAEKSCVVSGYIGARAQLTRAVQKWRGHRVITR